MVGSWSAVLPSIVDAAERDSEFATAVQAEIQRHHATPKIVGHAIIRHEPPEDTDPGLIASLVLGPLSIDAGSLENRSATFS